MSLAFEDFEKDYPSTESKQSKSESTPSVVKKPSAGVKPSMSDAMSQAWGQASPVIQAGMERAINPIHYKGDQEDYTSIDWPLTAAHAGAEAVAAKRIWDFATGKSQERKTEQLKAEQFKRQNDIAEANAAARNAPKPVQPVAPKTTTSAAPITPVAQPAATPAERTIGAAPAAQSTFTPEGNLPQPTREQATQMMSGMQEHPNPITALKESEVGALGQSEQAGQTKQVEASKKQIKGKAGAAVSPKLEFASEANIPEGTMFKKGWGGADSWLNDQVGKDKAKIIRETMNQGRGFGSGKEALQNAATAMSEFGNLNWQHQHEPHIPSKENRARLGIEPPEQHGPLNKKFRDIAKVGGAAGLLLTLAEGANAAQREKAGQKGSANEFLFNLLGSLGGKAAGAGFSAATYAPSLGENEQQELAKRRGMAPTIR